MSEREEPAAKSALRDAIRLEMDSAASYADARRAAARLREDFYDEVARGVAPHLNAAIAEMPCATLEERRKLATWCNAELRQLGLAIRCPTTSKPAIMVADSREMEHGRFRLQVRNERGDMMRTFTSSSTLPPAISLMQCRSRAEPFAREGQKRSR